MKKYAYLLVLIGLLALSPSALASDKIQKGERAPTNGRIFNEEEVIQLMKDLAELDFLRDKVVLLEEKVEVTENLVEKWRQQWENEKEKNLLLIEKYASLDREYEIYRDNSNRKWWYRLGIALITGYLAGEAGSK